LHWLGLSTITYRIPSDAPTKTRSYEAVYRTRHGLKQADGETVGKTQRGRLDANDIIAITNSTLRPELNNRLVVVMQYRPAVNAYTLEFPAGCIDPHETNALASGLRELREETGLTAKPNSARVAYQFTYEPGISSSLGNAITCEVDLDAPENKDPKPELEDDEWSLQLYLLPLEGLHRTLTEFAAKHEHVLVDSRLGAYALGLEHA
ncbi:hypothetical protein BCR44DRAFT_103707, partial [Catenaria anguillulae PL171]